MRNNAFIQWAIGGLSVVAFILLLKMGASYLPEGGPLGAAKKVLGTI